MDKEKTITQWLNEAVAGDPSAAEKLANLVYEQLRLLAKQKMAGEAPGHTLQATALVNEAWLRLDGAGKAAWENRAHFFGAAAEAMRRILVEHARRKHRIKRGGHAETVEIEEFMLVHSPPAEELLAVHDALDKLAGEEPRWAEVVKQRYFMGLTQKETSAVIGMSAETIKNDWKFAKKWLHSELSRQGMHFPQKVGPESPPD